MSKFLEAALRYASEGYPVLPCKPGTKHPLTKRGFHDASTDPTQLRDWWEANPTANVAVVPGEGGSVVVDVDGEVGRTTLGTLRLPDAGRIVTSPGKGGGFHYWYRLPPNQGIVGNGRPWPGVDIRGHNGYVMVPPSIHPDTGTAYAYAKDEDLTVLPSSFLVAQSEVSDNNNSLQEIRNILRKVSQKPTKAATIKLKFYVSEILTEDEGKRHQAMLDATWDLATLVFAGGLTHDDVLTYGEAYKTACEPHDTGDDFSSALIGAYRKLPAPAESKLYLKLASESVPRKARWLWHEKIPLGALSLLAGRQGIGKSTVNFDLIARLSRGKLEGDLLGVPRGAVIVATEDSWEEKILPSIIFSGADLKRVGYVTSRTEDWVTDVILPDDLDEIQEVCDQVNAGMLIFDPLTSRLSRSIDTHKDSDVRRALEPLAGFARKTGTSVLGLIHVNKGGGDPLSSVMGSQAFTAAARSVLFAASYDDDTYGLSVIKSNSGPSNNGTDLYKLEVGEIHAGGDELTAVRVDWMGGMHITDTMEEITSKSKKDKNQDKCTDWLRSYLSNGPVLAKVTEAAIDSSGYSKAAGNAAAAELGVIKKSLEARGPWYWRLPDE